MSQDWIDTLTRAVATPASGRPVWRALAGALSGTVASAAGGLVGRGPLQPQPAQAAPGSNCMALNHDATCPPGTEKQPKPGNTPTMNGCGPEGGSIKIPQGYGRADYTGSCNQHDVCYEDCYTSKDTCDEEFLEDMLDACAAAYPGALNSLFRFGCYERAYIYYQAVSNFGDDAWIAAQQKACECCKSKVYCNCNKKCYDDVSVCLNECKVTLGCFTGICGPAEPGQCPA